MDLVEKKLKIDDIDLLPLFGFNDNYISLIENKFHATVTVRGNNIILRGTPAEIKAIETIFKEMIYILRKRGDLTTDDVSTIIDLVDSDKNGSVENDIDIDKESIIYYGANHIIRSRTQKQFAYWKKVRKNDIVFAIGPAGTGKTFLAVAMALASLKRNEVTKIILSRPAVEAGESLGFLPGDLREKIDPYLRPLMDALFYMLNAEKLKNMLEKNIIEIIPLAYMRGRTLSNSFIVLDEAQNATVTQMKMFLTRLGENSKAIVTGDITQIDLNKKEYSGLINANHLLHDIEGIDFVYFDNTDVVRHKLVAEIIKAYEREAEQREAKPEAEPEISKEELT